MSASRVVIALLGVACAACGNSHPPPGASGSGVAQGRTITPHLALDDPEQTSHLAPAQPSKPASVPAAAVLPPFPTDLPLHTPLDVPLENDRALRVAHAPDSSQRAVVYLHGMCGDPKGADPWIDLATQYATVITVRANVKCPDRPGYKWPQEPEQIQPRIDAALAYVRELRNGYLKTDEVTLIGYSQGSHRGEKLAAAFPERYRDLVLGGPPTAVDPGQLKSARRVAILGGELEDTAHMLEGLSNLEAAGIRSRFFLLPRAHHGTYGPEGRRVMTEVLSWIWPDSK